MTTTSYPVLQRDLSEAPHVLDRRQVGLLHVPGEDSGDPAVLAHGGVEDEVRFRHAGDLERDLVAGIALQA